MTASVASAKRVQAPKLKIQGGNVTSFMAKNVGTVDRVLRVLLGATLLVTVFAGPRTPLGWLGLVPLFTGLFGTCPLYSLLGLNTCGVTRA
ncbi:MAG: DUF2892 domain-containing protein [Gemmatimonadaceae bacterium]